MKSSPCHVRETLHRGDTRLMFEDLFAKIKRFSAAPGEVEHSKVYLTDLYRARRGE